MLDPHSPVPLYHQLKVALSQKISSGEWAPGQPIPPERELITLYQVSRTTVRQALDDLVTSGLLYRVHGKGTFVAERKIVQTLADLTGFAEELELRGIVPEIHLLGCGLTDPPEEAAAALDLPPDAPVWCVQRLVRAGGEPLFVDQSCFPESLRTVLTRERLAEAPIYRLLEEQGLTLIRGRQEIAAIAIGPEQARLLGCEAGAPVLAVTRTTYTNQDRPLEWSRAVYRSDRYQYLVELRRRPRTGP